MKKMTRGYGVAGVSIVHPYSLSSLSEHVRTPLTLPWPPTHTIVRQSCDKKLNHLWAKANPSVFFYMETCIEMTTPQY